jgi:hypothetical protein
LPGFLPLRRRLLAVIALLLALLASGPGQAQSTTPATCRFGANLESLYDIDIGNDRFGAELWVWTLCPSAEVDPLQSIAFPTATSLRVSEIESVPTGGSEVYRYVRVQGTFRHDWDMQAYPFDRQRVVIPIDETRLGADDVLFAADAANSFLTPDALTNRQEWQVGGFAIAASVSEEEETYGLPNVVQARYARIEIAFTLARIGMLTFVKLTAGVFAAGMIALMSFFYDGRESKGFSSRLGLLVGTLFAVLVNMRTADQFIGDMGRMTLVTEIHLLTVGLIVVLAIWALRDWWLAEAALPITYPNWALLGWTGGLYVLTLGVLIGRTAGWL